MASVGIHTEQHCLLYVQRTLCHVSVFNDFVSGQKCIVSPCAHITVSVCPLCRVQEVLCFRVALQLLSRQFLCASKRCLLLLLHTALTA